MKQDNLKIISKALGQYWVSLRILQRKTAWPMIVAMVGLIGSGKSSVARALAPLIGATIIRSDDVRVILRKKKQNYDAGRSISEKVAFSVLERGGNVVMDSDFIDPQKRESLEKMARKFGAKVVYLRTFAEPDSMIGKLATATHTPQDFFGGASSVWKGKNKGNVVVLREMWRRTPLHYEWFRDRGGHFVLKKLRIKFIAELDTSANWQVKINGIAKKLKTF